MQGKKSKVTKAQARKAVKTLETFIHGVNKQFIKDLTCVCCKENKITPIKGYGLEQGHVNALKQDEGAWHGGVVQRMYPGYGSKYDTDSFFAAICDPCIQKLSDNKIIVNYRGLRKEIQAKKIDFNFTHSYQ